MARFYRAHGLGNDYIVIEPDQDRIRPTRAVIQRLCHRHFGLGSDGVLWPGTRTPSGFALRIFNPDGSEAEKSGNGLRIFARYLYDQGLLRDRCTIETLGGQVAVEVRPQAHGPPLFSVAMGKAHFPTPHPHGGHEADGFQKLEGSGQQDPGSMTPAGQPMLLPGLPLPGCWVSIGNPHWVTFIPNLQAIPLATLGPEIENHPWFPNRTNVQFAEVLDKSRVRVAIWERGAGETMASGSSACAVVAAGVLFNRLHNRVVVVMEGGELEVSIDAHFYMQQTGPVSAIAQGYLAQDLIKALET